MSFKNLEHPGDVPTSKGTCYQTLPPEFNL